MKKILALLMVIGLTLAVVAEEKVKEIVEEKKVEEPTLKGWGNKLFDVLDQEVEDTKSYQKKQWEKMKKQFKNLFNNDEKEWNELDKTTEGKDETKEEK